MSLRHLFKLHNHIILRTYVLFTTLGEHCHLTFISRSSRSSQPKMPHATLYLVLSMCRHALMFPCTHLNIMLILLERSSSHHKHSHSSPCESTTQSIIITSSLSFYVHLTLSNLITA